MHKNIYIDNIPTSEIVPPDYNSQDVSLIVSFNSESAFNQDTDYIEYHVYNGAKQLVDTVERLSSFKIYDNKLNIFPESDLESRGYVQGKYYTYYNFLTPLLSSSVDELYYITEISSDRTEIRLASNDILGGDTVDSTQTLINRIEQAPYYEDFYINFGDNNLVVVNNIALDDTDPDNVTVLLKLYQPLNQQFGINTTCWVVDKVAESTAYLVNIETAFEVADDTVRLKGPNYNIPVKTQENKATVLTTLQDLKNSPSASLTSQLNSALNTPGVELNTDYSDFSNFIFFSTARTRLENFYYKLGLIEEYTYSASLNSDSISFYNSSSLSYWDTQIDNVITNFDGYEYYLYFESGSTAWPKSNNTPPYINIPTTSSLGQIWLTNALAQADTYDNDNKDLLIDAIPTFIKDNPANINYQTFTEMVAQMYDEIWLYTKNVTEKYNNTNGVNQGLSKDLVGQALKDLGIKLYQNNFTSENLYSTYLGITPSGSLLPTTGQELIETYITASGTGSLIPINDLSSETYKRLYHNLPLLLKKKGTTAGLRTLINAFGIPDTILRINEFGGKDKNTNTWDYYQEEYDYALQLTGSYYFSSSFSLNPSWNAPNNVPGAVEFRFKAESAPPTNSSQSLWFTEEGLGIYLEYTGSGLNTGSYSGSIIDPYYQYGTLKFISGTASASVYLPFFNDGWWSVLVNSSSAGYELYAKNSIYNGDDGNTLGFQSSSSLNIPTLWSASSQIFFASSSANHIGLSGSLQEIRYYTQPITEESFNAYVMNPSSIEESEFLAFRATLGNELYTSSISSHPKITGSWSTTSSFVGTSNFYISSTPVYIPNTETAFYDQPAVGIKNAVSNKIKLQGQTVYGDTLSNLASLQQDYPVSQSYTRDTNYLEVGFSPQNEINEDIMNTFGYFNIGDYIGDPRQITSSNLVYPDLERLKDDYFKKYTGTYNYQDYFRLIKFYDNSLFKLIKDFIPARTAAATGAIVKQHLLERNRQRPAQLTWTQPEYTGSAVSVARDYQTGSIGVFDGGPAGAVNNWVNISQSYTSSILGPEGLVTFVESSEKEFYDGAYSGSNIDVIDGKLQDNPLLGPEYRLRILDLQDLSTTLDGNYTAGLTEVGGLGYFNSGSLIFDELVNPNQFYNIGTGLFTPGFSVIGQVNVNVSGSLILGGESISVLSYTLNLENLSTGQILSSNTARYDNGTTFLTDFEFTASLSVSDVYLQAGNTYRITWIATVDASGDGSGITIYDIPYTTYTVDVQDLNYQSSYYNDPTVYTQQNFPGNINQFSDYNVLLNNVYSNAVSTKYFDVDYTTDILNPTNFQSIISQSAVYAQVQDSNYDPTSIFFENRFAGTKNTGQVNTSISFPPTSIPSGYPIDEFSEYIAYFDWIGGSDPQYPGGGNIHLTTLIKTDGTIIGLDALNKNLEIVEKLFKAGTIPSIYLQTFSVVEPAEAVNIIEGGALYQTIIFSTGSSDRTIDLISTPETGGDQTSLDFIFVTASFAVLTDSASVSPTSPVTNGIYALQTGQNTYGPLSLIGSNRDGVGIYNKRVGEIAGKNGTNVYFPYEDSLFPLQVGDFIRFGNTGSYSISNQYALDGTFEARGILRIKNITLGAGPTVSSSIEVAPVITAPLTSSLQTPFTGTYEYQNFRIFRRIPNETFILVDKKPLNPGSGIIVPYNFNPNIDPIALAKQAGLI
jgi:hypothetical protein